MYSMSDKTKLYEPFISHNFLPFSLNYCMRLFMHDLYFLCGYIITSQRHYAI